MTSPSNELPAGELDLIRAAYLGPTRFTRVCANGELADLKAAGCLSPCARRLLGILAGPAHKVRRKRAGRRLAFSLAYLIATRPPVVAPIGAGVLRRILAARPEAGPAAEGPAGA